MEGEEDWKYNDTRCVERLIFFNSRILKGFVSNGGGRESIGGWRVRREEAVEQCFSLDLETG